MIILSNSFRKSNYKFRKNIKQFWLLQPFIHSSAIFITLVYSQNNGCCLNFDGKTKQMKVSSILCVLDHVSTRHMKAHPPVLLISFSTRKLQKPINKAGGSTSSSFSVCCFPTNKRIPTKPPTNSNWIHGPRFARAHSQAYSSVVLTDWLFI